MSEKLWFDSRKGQKTSPSFNGDHPASYSVGNKGCFPHVSGVNLATYFHPVPTSCFHCRTYLHDVHRNNLTLYRTSRSKCYFRVYKPQPWNSQYSSNENLYHRETLLKKISKDRDGHHICVQRKKCILTQTKLALPTQCRFYLIHHTGHSSVCNHSRHTKHSLHLTCV